MAIRRSIMKNFRLALGIVLVGLLAFLASCGTNTTSSGSQTGQTTTATSQTGQTTSTGAQTVSVMMFDDHITSSLTTFTPGMPYHFVVTNKGSHPYAFAMMSQDREQEMEHMTQQERHRAALYMYDNIAPGQTMMFDYTFSQSMMGMGQHLEFACFEQGQNQVFMRLPFD
jgi:hypothetical protein